MLLSYFRFLRPLFWAVLFILSGTGVQGADEAPAGAEALKLLSSADLWKKGNEALSGSRWDEARDAYLELVERKELSAQLFNNLGVAERKREQTGEAVLWFSRAVALDPWLPEARQNLQSMSIVSEEGINRFLPPSAPERWFLLVKMQAWKIAAWATGWFTLIAVVWLVWWTPRQVWPAVALLCACGAGLLISCAGIAVRAGEDAPVSRRSIVLARGVAAYAAPAEKNSTMVIQLPPGSSVVPLETRGNWRYCEFPVEKSDGGGQPMLRGWVRESWITPLWPWDPALVE